MDMAEKEVSWRDIVVDVGWGKLRGKTCIVGNSDNEDGLRIVGVHGWLDNANTFDTLVPLLPTGVEVLVLDLPGHGLSDHLPLGAHYDLLTYVYNLWTAVKNLDWNKFVFMGHSMGAAVSNYFTALFPDHVIALINLDYIKPFTLGNRVNVWRNDAFTLFKAEKENREPVVHSESEAIDRLLAARVFLGGAQSGIDQNAAYTLLPRSARKVEGGYIWSHDPKARSNFLSIYGSSNWMEAISSIKCPVLIVVASNGVGRIPDVLSSKELRAYQSSAQWFDITVVEGLHHVHLTNPEHVAPPILGLLQKLALNTQRKLQAQL